MKVENCWKSHHARLNHSNVHSYNFTNASAPATISLTIVFHVVLPQQYLLTMLAAKPSTNVETPLTIQTSSDRITGLVNQDARIVVKFDETSIWSLNFLARSNYYCMSDIASTDLVCDTAVCGVFRAKISLFLDDDDDAVTCKAS